MRSRRDELELLLGTLVSGLSALGFITLASRSLGIGHMGPIVHLWTIWALSTGVLNLSVQQHVIVSAGTYRSVISVMCSGQVLKIVLPMTGGVALSTVIWGTEFFGDGSAHWPLIASSIPLGCASVAAARGLWAGRRAFRTVALLFAAENILRVAAAVALSLSDAGPISFSLAILIGFVVALYGPRDKSQPIDKHQPTSRTYGGAIAGLLGHATLVLPPSLMAVKSAEVLETSSVFLLLALLRSPYQLAFGLIPKFAVDRLSRRPPSTDSRSVTQPTNKVQPTARTRWLFGTIFSLAIVSGSLLLPALLDVLFGTEVAVSPVASLLAAAATFLAILNLWQTIAVADSDLNRQLISVWMSSSFLGLIILMIPSRISMIFTLSVMFGIEGLVALGLYLILRTYHIPYFLSDS